MDVFDDDYAWSTLQFGQRRAEEHVASGRRGQHVLERATDLLGNIVKWPERARRQQRVAAAPQDAKPGRLLAHEMVDQGGLADARLASHQGNATFAALGRIER